MPLKQGSCLPHSITAVFNVYTCKQGYSMATEGEC